MLAQGHLIDSGLLSQILNTILREGGDYQIRSFDVGKTPREFSQLAFEVNARDEQHLQVIADRLTQLGVYEPSVPEARTAAAEADKHAPEEFYSTTNHRTEVFYQGAWRPVVQQRMDAVLVWNSAGQHFICTKIRDVRRGNLVVCGSDSVRVYPTALSQRNTSFAFMSNDVSSERSCHTAVGQVAREMRTIASRKGKIVVVCGPVVIHTGAGGSLASLITGGYIHGFLGGNAAAVHDLEQQLFGTSLGVDLSSGKVIEEGHTHHMRAINAVYGYGSIRKMVDSGNLNSGLMHAVITSGIPCCLAGSIRDDGPLPETVNDMIEAQRQYGEIIRHADMIIILSSMLHAIGVGNMAPSWVNMVCVDINPAVVTKLSDRGSGQTIGIVSDVGLFVRMLAEEMNRTQG